MLPKQIQDLINSFARLPGIGQKTAERLTFHCLRQRQEDLEKSGQAFINLKRGLKLCPHCQNITEKDVCDVCSDSQRDQTIVCVVEDPLDIVALEKVGEYQGLYHVLHGIISPIKGVNPSDLKIAEIKKRLEENPQIKEIIFALNPTMGGEATCAYIADLLKPLEIKITRLAHGLSSGSDIEYADIVTLKRALEGRREY